jgi:hypothetical protein
MGESKRRQERLGEQYGQEPRILPWLPITESQLIRVQKVANQGAWIGIAVVIVFWLTLRFIGPALGLWEVHG